MPTYIYGIDPGFKNMGVAIYNFDIKKVVFVAGFHTPSDLDFGTRSRKIFKFMNKIYKEYPPDIAIIEEIDYRSRLVDRQAQAYLTAGLAIILAALPDAAGYHLVNKNTLRKELRYTERKQGMKIFKIMRFLDKKDKEHIADALSLIDYYLLRYNKTVVFNNPVIYRLQIKLDVFKDIPIKI